MMNQSMDQFKAGASRYQEQSAQVQGYVGGANVQQTIVRQRIAELAEVMTRIGQQVQGIHGRVVPAAPQPAAEGSRGAPQSYDQMLDMLVSAASEIRARLDEIGERV